MKKIYKICIFLFILLLIITLMFLLYKFCFFKLKIDSNIHDKITTDIIDDNTKDIADDNTNDIADDNTNDEADTDILKSILKYNGLDTNPNRLAVGFYSDFVTYIDIDKLSFISKYDLDMFFGMSYISFAAENHFVSATTFAENIDFKYNKDFKMFIIQYTYNKNYNRFFNFFFSKKLNAQLISNCGVYNVKGRKYFYITFKIIDLNKKNSIRLDYILNIIVSYVLEIDVEEIKKICKNTVNQNTIYLVNRFENNIPHVSYTNNIINQSDINNFRDPRNKNDRRNVKFMLLNIK